MDSSQKTEGGPRTDGRRQKAEDRIQKTLSRRGKRHENCMLMCGGIRGM